MKINLLSHHAVQIVGKEATILLDPSKKDVVKVSSSLVIQAGFGDLVPLEFDREKNGYLIYGPGEYEVKGVPVVGISADGVETVYLFEVEKVRLCYLGTLSRKIPDNVLEDFGDVDVLFLPLDGETGLSSKLAVEVINQIEPFLVLPLFEEEKSLAEFSKELGESDLRRETSLLVTKNTLPQETEVVVLNI